MTIPANVPSIIIDSGTPVLGYYHQCEGSNQVQALDREMKIESGKIEQTVSLNIEPIRTTNSTKLCCWGDLRN